MKDELFTDNETLQKQLKRARRELTMLYEVSNAMRATLELNHILYIILTGVTSHKGLEFNRAILFLENTKERCLEPKMAIGPESTEDAHRIWQHISKHKQHLDDLIKKDNLNDTKQCSLYESIKDLKIPLAKLRTPSINKSQDTSKENTQYTETNNLLATVYAKGTPTHITSKNIAQYADDPLWKVFQTDDLIVMPLKAKNKVNGLIIADNIYTKKPITKDDLRIFIMLANQAGLAIENSRLYEMVKHKSHTDAITNIWNHGFFQSQLTQELEHSENTNEPLSLIMIDIDNFKIFNDTYGHQNGDVVLKKLASVLKKSSRPNDYVCRYGGEEFTIILPQTNKEQGYMIAERLRQNIEEHNFPSFTSQHPSKVTVSIGLASFHKDAQTKETLVAKADKAMYIAKFSGKNQTCLA